MLKNLVLTMAMAGLVAACSHKDDKGPVAQTPPKKPAPGGGNNPFTFGDEDDGDSFGTPKTSPGVPSIPVAPKVTGPISGTADGEMILKDGSKKKIEIRPIKTKTINPCDIVKFIRPDGTEQYLGVTFEGESVAGEVKRVSFNLRDDKFVEQVEPYSTAIHDRSYAGEKSPLKLNVANDKSTLWVDLFGITPAANKMNCSVEIAGSPVVYRALYKDDKGVEQKMDTQNKGAKISLNCHSDDPEAQVKSIEVAGFCWIATQTQTFSK